MIKWCLNLRMTSTAAYHNLRTSGMLVLPSERTLRDYYNVVKGGKVSTLLLFSNYLMKPEMDTFPSLIIDGMHISTVCTKLYMQ